MNEREFLKIADRKAWESFRAGSGGWDYVIITASNASQGEGFRMQLQERLTAGFLPAATHYGVVPDPEGERVGNGGAVLGALRYIHAREKSLAGLKALVILSSGDSRRVAQYSAVGKIFSPVPRLLPNGRASTLFDEAMIALSPIPSQISEGVLVISGDVMLAFDASEFDPQNADAAAIAFPEPAATGAGHGVFLQNERGNIAKVWHKQKPERLMQYGAVDAAGNVCIDTGAVFFAPRTAEALYGLLCEDGRCTDASFRKIVNGYLAPSLYVDFFYPLAEDATFDGYLAEVPEGKMSEELLALRGEIWRVLRPFRIKLCTLKPSRFIHFGSTPDVVELMSAGIAEYAFLGWRRQVSSSICDERAAAYNSIAENACFGERDYLEDSIVRGGSLGDGVILSGTEIEGESIPPHVVLHTLKLVDGSCVTRIYGTDDNPKSPDVRLFGKALELTDIWQSEEKNLWNALIYPACATRRESIEAALNLYRIVQGNGDVKAWRESRRESLYTSFCKADGRAIQQWQQKIRQAILAGQ